MHFNQWIDIWGLKVTEFMSYLFVRLENDWLEVLKTEF